MAMLHSLSLDLYDMLKNNLCWFVADFFWRVLLVDYGNVVTITSLSWFSRCGVMKGIPFALLVFEEALQPAEILTR